MRIDQWERVKQLYSKALDLEPGQRQEYLDTVCAGDPSGRADIEALLAFEQHARGFLETPALDVVAKAIVAGEYGWDLAGRTLVHYRVIERIGAGGMGVV